MFNLIDNTILNNYHLEFITAFTVSDRFTKGCFAIALPDTKSDTIVTSFWNQYVALFGVPRVIVIDNASYFTCSTWTKFMTFLNVKHQFIAAYHCQANGVA